MGAVQTVYPVEPAAGTPGMIANMEEWNGITRTADNAINFGDLVARSATSPNHNCRKAAAASSILGLAIRNVVLYHTTLPDQYQQYESVGIMTMGVMWVTAGEAVVAGDKAYYNAASGKYTKTNTDIEVKLTSGREAVFDSGGAADALVKLALR